MTLTLERLREAVANDAAIRRVQRLQPVGGPGDKIFPPTYPPPDNEKRTNPAPRHVFETRRINGATVWCVLIDSVQSQANRLEEALKAARGDALAFPVIAVDFSGTEVDDIGGVTTLDAPHRVFDAIIRDSEFNGTRFKETEAGRRLVAAKASNALAVYQLSPTALIFGAWNSTGEGGGLGAKFPAVWSPKSSALAWRWSLNRTPVLENPERYHLVNGPAVVLIRWVRCVACGFSRDGVRKTTGRRSNLRQKRSKKGPFFFRERRRLEKRAGLLSSITAISGRA